MKRSRDPLALSPHWHVDCRLEAELPDDNVVGTRFLINVAFGSVAVAAIIFTGWLGYLSLLLNRQVQDWDQRIAENRPEARDIKRVQTDYAAESAKIDQAYALVRPQLKPSALLASLGRTRPDQVMVDAIEWTDPTVIVLRGSLREASERASQLLGAYVTQLRRDEKIGPLFREIVLTDVDRGTTGDLLKFEISFRLKGTKP